MLKFSFLLTSVIAVENPPNSFLWTTSEPPGKVPTSNFKMTLLRSSSASSCSLNSGSVWSRPEDWMTSQAPPTPGGAPGGYK